MSRSSTGCTTCAVERRVHEFKRIELKASAKRNVLRLYQCRDCGQWYEVAANGRLYAITPFEARRWMATNKEGV